MSAGTRRVGITGGRTREARGPPAPSAVECGRSGGLPGIVLVRHSALQRAALEAAELVEYLDRAFDDRARDAVQLLVGFRRHASPSPHGPDRRRMSTSATTLMRSMPFSPSRSPRCTLSMLEEAGLAVGAGLAMDPDGHGSGPVKRPVRYAWVLRRVWMWPFEVEARRAKAFVAVALVHAPEDPHGGGSGGLAEGLRRPRPWSPRTQRSGTHRRTRTGRTPASRPRRRSNGPWWPS